MSPEQQRILDDPAASYWLKDAIRAAAERDIVDALGDAEILFLMLRAEHDQLSGSRSEKPCIGCRTGSVPHNQGSDYCTDCLLADQP